MTDHDTIQRFLFEQTDVRGEIVSLESAFQNAFSQQNCPLELKKLFGEFLSGAALLSEVLKFDGVLTLQARGDGSIPLIMAEATSSGDLRGIIRTSETNNTSFFDDVNNDTLRPLPDIIGNGVLVITIDPAKGERYQGIVPLDAPNLELCLSHYFDRSEQLPTYIKLFSSEKNCGGLFLQCLPAQLEKNLDTREDTWSTLTQLSSTLSEKELFELNHSESLYRLFHEHECRLLSEKKLQFACSCSKQRSTNAIVSMGRQEAFDLLKALKTLTSDCQFCGKRYEFGEKALTDIFGPENNTH